MTERVRDKLCGMFGRLGLSRVFVLRFVAVGRSSAKEGVPALSSDAARCAPSESRAEHA